MSTYHRIVSDIQSLSDTIQPIVHRRWASCLSPVVTLLATPAPVHLTFNDHDTHFLQAGLTHVISCSDNRFTYYYLGKKKTTNNHLMSVLSQLIIRTVTPGKLLSRAADLATLLRATIHDAEPSADSDTIAQYLTCTHIISALKSPDTPLDDNQHLSAFSRTQPAATILSDLHHLLENTDPVAIRKFLLQKTGIDNVTAGIYEMFMSYYDPQTRNQYGIYHTPQEIIDFTLGLVTDLLGNFPDQPAFFDPAAGTGLFLTSAVARHPEAICRGYEIMPAAVLLASHNDPPITLTTTDSLSITTPLTTTGIPIIIGNPPYRGNSTNPSSFETPVARGGHFIRTWSITSSGHAQPIYETAVAPRTSTQPTFIGELLKDYFICDHHWVTERNLKWLHDDYVKFIRWAHYQIDNIKTGIIAFVTNHSYLSSPTFRGMRWQLLRSFSDIYVINLQTSSSTATDDNLFAIKQGTAISIMVRSPDVTTRPARIHYILLQGSRQEKISWLTSACLDSIAWTTHTPGPPYYSFIPGNSGQLPAWTVAKAMPIRSAAIVTGRDQLTIGWSRHELHETLLQFSQLPPEAAREQFQLGSDARDWQTALAQADLLKSGPDTAHIIPVLYRPFDVRYTYYTGRSRGILCMPRRRITDLLIDNSNLALITVRRTPDKVQGPYVLVSDLPVISGAIRSDNCSIDTIFPLYRHDNQGNYIPNFDAAFIDTLQSVTGLRCDAETTDKTFSPQDTLAYIYAVLHSTRYRTTYRWGPDFPPLPPPDDQQQFRALVDCGHQLIQLHLTPIPDRNNTRTLTVPNGYPRYVDETIWINPDHCVTEVSNQVWNYHIGSYQPLLKWIKDRRQRGLATADLDYYRQIISNITTTIELTTAIDHIY